MAQQTKQKIFEIYSFPSNHEGSVYEKWVHEGLSSFEVHLGESICESYSVSNLCVYYLGGIASQTGKQYYLIPVE